MHRLGRGKQGAERFTKKSRQRSDALHKEEQTERYTQWYHRCAVKYDGAKSEVPSVRSRAEETRSLGLLPRLLLCERRLAVLTPRYGDG